MKLGQLLLAGIAPSIPLCPCVTEAVPITDPSFFGGGATVVNFDSFPANTALSNQIAGLDFSSESLGNIGSDDFTDPNDVNNRFDAAMGVYDALNAGGAPTSGSRFASGGLRRYPNSN